MLFFELLCVGLIVVCALVEITLHAIDQLHGKSALSGAFAQSSGNMGTVFPMIGVGRTYSQFMNLGASLFSTTLLEFPAVHDDVVSLRAHFVLYVFYVPCALRAQKVISALLVKLQYLVAFAR